MDLYDCSRFVDRQGDIIMGKKGTWLSAVKKAFRSPSKDKDFVKTTPKDLDLVGDIPPLEVPVRYTTSSLENFNKLYM